MGVPWHIHINQMPKKKKNCPKPLKCWKWVTDQKGLMGRDGDGGPGRWFIGEGDENDVGEAGPTGSVVVVVERRPKPEKSDLRLQVLDLPLQLLLRLVRLLVALLARARVICVVLILARHAPHRLRLRLALNSVCRRCAPAPLHCWEWPSPLLEMVKAAGVSLLEKELSFFNL